MSMLSSTTFEYYADDAGSDATVTDESEKLDETDEGNGEAQLQQLLQVAPYQSHPILSRSNSSGSSALSPSCIPQVLAQAVHRRWQLTHRGSLPTFLGSFIPVNLPVILRPTPLGSLAPSG